MACARLPPLLLGDSLPRHAPPPLPPSSTSPPPKPRLPNSPSPHSNGRVRAAATAADEQLRARAVELQYCASRCWLRRGKALHARLLRSGLQPDTFLYDCLLNMYCKCGCMADARMLFEGMPHRDVVAWTAMVAGYTAVGDAREGARLFAEMKLEDVLTNEFAFAAALKACSMAADLEFTRQVHAQVIKMESLSDSYVGSSLVEAYVSCTEMELAERVFLRLPECNDVSWNAMFCGYSQDCDSGKLMLVLEKLMESDAKISKYILPTVMKFCAEQGLPRLGKAVHALVVKAGLETDNIIGSCLIDMYSKCLSAGDAYEVFVGVDEPDVVDCSAMIACFDRHDLAEEAFYLFAYMARIGVEPNHYIFVSLSSVASRAGDLNLCRSLHAYIVKSGFAMVKEVGDAILNMYVKSGALQDARLAFDAMLQSDTVSWNTLLSGFHGGSNCHQGLKVFNEMIVQGFVANKYTYVSILRSCSSLMDLRYGCQVHACIQKSGLQDDPGVARALLDMYAKSGCFTSACLVFDGLKERDVFSWTSIISGFAKTDQGEKAIECFRSMLRESARPNDATLASSLSACSDLASLSCGLLLHSWTIKAGWNNPFVSGALLDMYVKCGSIMDAESIFYSSDTRDEVLWNTIICGYSHHGHGLKALKAFQDMIDEGKRPDGITLVGVLSACSHAGLLDEGRKYFNSMSTVYGITPAMEHYACMVDILAKAGKLDEAESLINHMPMNPDASIWKTILGACRLHANVEIAERAADKLFELEPYHESAYIILSNIYADLRRWSDAAGLRKLLLERGLKKEPGCSWIEINGQIHVFLPKDGCMKYY